MRGALNLQGCLLQDATSATVHKAQVCGSDLTLPFWITNMCFIAWMCACASAVALPALLCICGAR